MYCMSKKRDKCFKVFISGSQQNSNKKNQRSKNYENFKLPFIWLEVKVKKTLHEVKTREGKYKELLWRVYYSYCYAFLGFATVCFMKTVFSAACV